MIIKLLLAIFMLMVSFSDAYCFTDKEYHYSIVFPKGWKMEKIDVRGNRGAQATSNNGAQMVVGAARQDTRQMEFTDQFAKYFTRNVTYPMAKQMCENVSVISAMAVTVLDKYDGISNTLSCDGNRIETMYFVGNGITYTITEVYKPSDSASLKAIFNSLKTFKVNN